MTAFSSCSPLPHTSLQVLALCAGGVLVSVVLLWRPQGPPAPSQHAASKDTSCTIAASDIEQRFGCAGRDLTVAALPQLTAQAALASAKNRTPTNITIVTHLTLDRLAMVEGQCAEWPGVISVAVYVPLLGGKAITVWVQGTSEEQHLIELDQAKERLCKLHRWAETRGELRQQQSCGSRGASRAACL